jgi:signal peptidase II
VSDGLKLLREQVHAVVPYRRRSTAIGVRWWMLGLLVVVLDQAAKLVVQAAMPYGQVIPLLDFFNLVHVWNTGAAFSFLADAGGWQRYFFIGLALSVSLWLAIALSKPSLASKPRRTP